jgi:hypothetical protein
MKLEFKGYLIRMLMIIYLIVAAFIGFKVGYALFSISSLPVQNKLFYITNYLTDILAVLLCIAFTAGVVYLAYISIHHFKFNYIAKTLLFKGKSTLQFIEHAYSKQPLKYLLITIIVLITVIKLELIGTGFMAFPDEVRYCQSGIAFQDLSNLKLFAAGKAIASTQGRPADALLNLIPITLQYITAHIYNLNYYESQNSHIVFICNFIIYCLILLVHFRFSKLLLNDSYLALASVVLFSTLTNSYLYLRHALPYDMSLLIFYLVIYKIVIYTEENSLSFKKSLLLGICSFFGFLVYPGYFPLFVVALFILFFYKLSKEDFFKKLYYSSCYIVGSILCLIIFEKMSRFVGGSYILDAIGLSKTINQGSYEESFVFILKYLFEVERLTGIILLISLLIYCFLMVYQIKNKTFKQHSLIMLLGIAFIGMYLTYASAGYFFHEVVFYGRLLHQYFPFICIFSIYAINELLTKITRKPELILFLISIIFIVNFGFNLINYNSFFYPRDICWQLSKANDLNALGNNIEYDDDRWSLMPKGKELKYYDIRGTLTRSFHDIKLIGNSFGGRIYIVRDLTKYHIFNPNDDYHLLDKKPSFINFKAYQYDSGANAIERHQMDKYSEQIEIYSK